MADLHCSSLHCHVATHVALVAKGSAEIGASMDGKAYFREYEATISPNWSFPTPHDLPFNETSIRGSMKYGSEQLWEGCELCLHGQEGRLV